MTLLIHIKFATILSILRPEFVDGTNLNRNQSQRTVNAVGWLVCWLNVEGHDCFQNKQDLII